MDVVGGCCDCWLAWVLLSSDRWHEGTDPLELAAAPDLQILDVAQVIEYSEMSAPTYRIRTTRDVLPSGVSAAMRPHLPRGMSRHRRGKGETI